MIQKGALPGSSIRNHLSGTVLSLTADGSLVWVGLRCGSDLKALITRPAFRELDLREGSR